MLGDFAGLDLQIEKTTDEESEIDDSMFNEHSSSRYQTSLYLLSFVILWLSPILLLNLM